MVGDILPSFSRVFPERRSTYTIQGEVTVDKSNYGARLHKKPMESHDRVFGESNHQSQKDFYAKTMMGGGKMHHWDPMLLNLYFGFLRVLKVARSKLRYDLDSMIASFSSNAKLDTEEIVDYLTIVQNRIPSPEIEIGTQRPKAERLRGMRFLLMGNYKVGQPSLQSDIRELFEIKPAYNVLSVLPPCRVAWPPGSSPWPPTSSPPAASSISPPRCQGH